MKSLRILLASICVFAVSSLSATSFTVSNLNDSGAGSLRQAILDANADGSATAGSPHIIDATGVNGTINMSGTHYTFQNHITINGPTPPSQLSIDGTGSTTGFIFLNQENNVTFRSRVQILRWLVIQNGTGGNGGCILNSNNMTLENCIVRGCSSGGFGGGIRNNNYNEADLTLYNCAVYGNTQTGGGDGGGGIITYGTCVVVNSTITGNSTNANGGGIKVRNFSGFASLTISNSIVAGNTASSGPDIGQLGGSIASNGGNFIGNNSGTSAFPTGSPNGNQDYAGSSLDPLFTMNASPGSITGDLTLQSGSPAIDIALNANIPGSITTDLAGNARTNGANVDSGAFEFGVAAPVPTMGEWGMIIFALLILSMGTVAFIRRKEVMAGTKDRTS